MKGGATWTSAEEARRGQVVTVRVAEEGRRRLPATVECSWWDQISELGRRLAAAILENSD